MRSNTMSTCHICIAEPTSKKQCLLTEFMSSEGSSKETEESFMETTTEDQSSTSPTVSRKHSFLYSWTKIYPWVSVEGTGEDITVFCKDCKRAGLCNDFAVGKKRPGKGWKKEYLQRHADSNQHAGLLY